MAPLSEASPGAQGRSAFLHRAGELLASSLNPAAMLGEVLALAIPSVADWGVVYIKRPDGGVDRAAHLHRDPALQALLHEMQQRWPEGPRVVGPLARVLHDGETALVTSDQHQLAARAAVDEAHREAQIRLGLGAGLLVPIVARDDIIGVLVLVQATSGRSFDDEDVKVAEEIGRRAGIAFDNARVHDRLAKLQRVTSLLTRPHTQGEVARVIVEEGAASVGARTAILSIIDATGTTLELLGAGGRRDLIREHYARVPLDSGVSLAEVARRGEDAYIGSREDLSKDEILTREGPVSDQAWAILALRDGARPLGALLFGFETRRAFDANTRSFLRAVADQSAQALARAQLAEAALVRQQLLESQNESTLDAIFFQDANGRPAFFNQRLLEVFGVSRDVPGLDRIEDRLARSMEAIEDPATFAQIAMRMEHEPVATMRFDLRLKDGRILDAYTAPVKAPDGTRLGRAWYYRDVTETRRVHAALLEARAQLAHREKLAAMGSLVSGVAHEIRTPLAYAANNAHLLQQAAAKIEGPLAASIRDSSAAISEAVDRIDRLVQDLRRFTRTTPPGTQTTDLGEAVRSAARLFEATHPGRARVSVETGEGTIVLIERIQLQQVILNLLENAADASPLGETVLAHAWSEGSSAILEVEDRGPGISASVRERMWEPFFTTKPEGTGLGLSIVRRIVEHHRGRVVCQSEEGKGTKFRVSLPLARPP